MNIPQYGTDVVYNSMLSRTFTDSSSCESEGLESLADINQVNSLVTFKPTLCRLFFRLEEPII